MKGQCGQCHSQQQWKPATLDHDKLFVLDRDHQTECVTCHTNDDYSRYTCYGCHEHQPGKIRSKHMKEGIANFENCVECHRSADEEPRKKGREPRTEARRSLRRWNCRPWRWRVCPKSVRFPGGVAAST